MSLGKVALPLPSRYISPRRLVLYCMLHQKHNIHSCVGDRFFFFFILIIKEVVTRGRPWPDIYDHDIDIYATSNFYYLLSTRSPQWHSASNKYSHTKRIWRNNSAWQLSPKSYQLPAILAVYPLITWSSLTLRNRVLPQLWEAHGNSMPLLFGYHFPSPFSLPSCPPSELPRAVDGGIERQSGPDRSTEEITQKRNTVIAELVIQ